MDGGKLASPGAVGRRRFLKASGGAAIASLSWGADNLQGRASPDGRSPAIEPRLLTGCCAYSFRKYLQSGNMTMEDFIRKGVELRCEGVDMTGYWWKSTAPEYVAGLRHLAFKNGMGFSGVACGATMLHADAARRSQAAAEFRKWTDATEALGAAHLRIFAGRLPPGATAAQGLAWCVETMKAACDYAAGKGITLGVEDHEGITQRAETCVELMERVNSPCAGINLDITNFTADSDEDQYRQIEACIPYASHTHIRDRFGNSHHPVDLDRVWRLFANAGYKGYMSVEYEGEKDAMTGVPRLLERVRELCRKYSTV